MFRRRRSPAREDDCNTETKRARLSKAPMYSQQREVFTRGDHVVDRQKQWASVGAWFLGPKAENGDVFRDLLTKAIDSHIGFRHRYITITSSIWWEAQRCAVMIFPSGSNLCRSYIHKLLNFLFCGDCFLFLALKIAAIQYSYKVSLLACLAGVGRVKG